MPPRTNRRHRPDVSTPRVSVIVVCYNHERFVTECLESVRAQSMNDIQLIVVDDASTDGSSALIQAWVAEHWPSARVVLHTDNCGGCRSLNEALGWATSEFVAFLAADDVWLPHKLATQIAQLDAADAKVGAVYTDATLIGEGGQRLPETFLTSRGYRYLPSGDLFDLFVIENFIPAPTTLFRRSVLTDLGAFDERLLFEDWDFWLRLASKYEIGVGQTPVAKYRVVATSLSHSLGDGVHAACYRVLRNALGRRPSSDAEIRRRISLLAQYLTRVSSTNRRLWALRWLRYGPELAAARSVVSPDYSLRSATTQ